MTGGSQTLPDDARTLLAAAEAVVERMAPRLRRGLPCLGYLRVRTAGGRREVMLSDRSLPDAPVAAVDWRRAPLAEIFFEVREGDDYDLDVDGRRLQGEVEARAILHVIGARLVGVIGDDVALRRDGERWSVVPRPRPTISRRSAADRRQRPSPMMVELDAHQKHAVDLPRGTAVLVLGDAGYGKTTVALHRALHLRRPPDPKAPRPRRPPPPETMVVVPTEGLRRLTELALERFDATDIAVTTFDEWIAREARAVFEGLPRRTSTGTTAMVSRLKRHPALQPALQAVAATTSAMRELGEGKADAPASRRDLLHLFGDEALLRGVIERSGGSLTARAIVETLQHTRLQFSKTTEERHAGVDAGRLAAVDGRALDDATPTADAGTIDPEDFAVLFELNRLRTRRDRGPRGRLRHYQHVVVDEAQELAPLELAVLGRAVAPGGTLTVAGDEKQRVDATSFFSGWPETMARLGRPEHVRVVLAESYRCPPGVEALARSVAGTDTTLIDDGSVVATRSDHECHRVALLCEVLLELIGDDRTATIAVVLRTATMARGLHAELSRGLPVHLALGGDLRFSPGVQVTCVDEVRGLEFDYVVIPDASPSSYPDTDPARRALYVALTRARHQVWLTTTTTWSPLLTDVTGT